MPKCIDDPSRSYTGNEPSPKGLGYCAHTQAVGTTKTGNDGNTWTVETTYKGTKRWVKKSGSSKRVPKEKKTSSKRKRKSTRKVSKKKTSGKRKRTKAMTGAGRIEYHRYASADKHWKKKKTSGKRKSPKRKSTKRTSKKKTSSKRKSPKRASTSKTSCAKIPRLKGYTLKSGEKYTIGIEGIDVTNDVDYEHHLKNFVYNPSTFKQKIEKILCSWTKGNKVTVTKFELWELENNYGWIDIRWK